MSWLDILWNLLLALVATELLGLSTVFAYALVKWAAKLYIPEPDRQNAENEWVSHIEGMRSHVKLWQLWEALGIFLFAAPKIGKQYVELKPYNKLEIRRKLRFIWDNPYVMLPMAIFLGAFLTYFTDNKLIQVGVTTQLVFALVRLLMLLLHQYFRKPDS
jgi:hypothetical protein